MGRLSAYVTIAKVSFQSALAYKAAVLSKFVFYTMFIYVFMRLWTTIYQAGSVEGYTLTQIVWYLIMTELVAFSFRSEVLGQMNSDVRDGSIVYQVNRPVHYVWYQYAVGLGRMALNVVAFSALALVLGLLFVGPLPTFSLWMLPFVGLSVLLGVTLNFLFYVLIGLTAFVLEDNFAVFLIYQKLSFMLGVFLPIEFLPEWLARAAKLMPFSYVSWAPAKLFVDFSWPLFGQMMAGQGLWVAVMAGLVALAYKAALGRLEMNGG